MISTPLSRALVSRFWRRPMRVGAGFTLVELLVVIGIIALLIAILMPALGKARESANSLKCQAQQRQIIQAMLLHANDHRGYMPLVGLPFPAPYGRARGSGLDPVSLQDARLEKYDYYGTGPENYHLMSVLGALAPQIGQQVNASTRATLEADMQRGILRRIFTCPSDREGDRMAGTVWEGGEAFSSYGYNEAALGWATSVVWDGSGLMSSPYPHSRLRAKMSSFVHPAELFLMADASPRADGRWQVYCDGDGELTLRDFFVTTNGPPDNPHAGHGAPAGTCANWDLIDMTRHRARMNVAFADGHVENVLLEEGSLSRISVNRDFPGE